MLVKENLFEEELPNFNRGYQKMPNGKHRGKHVTEIPLNYLQWWVENYEMRGVKSYQRFIDNAKIWLDFKRGDMDAERQAEIDAAHKEGFTFGKHAGKPWDQIPTDYLEYMLPGLKQNKWKWKLAAAVEKELEHRRTAGTPMTSADRHQEEIKKKAEEDAKKLDWVGDIGDDIEARVTVEKVIAFEGQWGMTYGHAMTDVDTGNKYFGKHPHPMQSQEDSVDTIYRIKAKVKDFGIRKKTKSTYLQVKEYDYQ